MKSAIFSLFLFTASLCSGQNYETRKARMGVYILKVENYDSLSNSDNEFNNFYYSTEDKPDGKLVVKNERGKVVRMAHYKNGKMGVECWWYSTGEKEWVGDWGYANELKHYTRWYKNGRKKSETDTNGLNRHWYENGNLATERRYKHGKLHGLSLKWHQNGMLKEEGTYSNGKQTGTWLFYREDGSLKEKVTFEN